MFYEQGAMAEEENGEGGWLDASKSNAWTDLALTLPIFLAYHLGVVLLEVRNAADLVTSQLIVLAHRHIAVYWGITLAIGAGMVVILYVLGRGKTFERKRFMFVAVEGVLYAVVMRLAAGYAVGSLPLAGSASTGLGPGIVMSLGAGFYEEVAFRAGLFGLGAMGIRFFFAGPFKLAFMLGWALFCALVFAGWHHIGALGESFDLHVFVFRTVCGLVLTAIYVFRGFAPAVWTHALYDVWALALAG
jgi:hypothetical protein